MQTNTTSLYDAIAAAIVNGALPRDFSLPKEGDGERETIFADGALDGIRFYHGEDFDEVDLEGLRLHPVGAFEPVNEADRALMIRALTAAGERHAGPEEDRVPALEKAEELFAALGKQCCALMLRAEMNRYVTKHRDGFKAGNLYEAALWLILRSADRECVKFGLILLENFKTGQNESVRQDIRTIGLSDEFTYFAVQVMETWPDGNHEIFSLAQKVHGWGRIHAVAQIKPNASSIKKWLLTEAVQNDVAPAYSALPCWNKSDAWFVLRNHPSYEQFAGIRGILHGLLDEGPVAGISVIRNRDEVLKLFLDEAEKQSEVLTLDDYQVIYEIYNRCRETEAKRSAISFQSKKILLTYRCACVTIDAVKEGKAMEMAIGTGIDVKRYIPDLLKASVKDHAHLCRYVMQDDALREEVLGQFRAQLPLEQMNQTPGMTLGLSNEYWIEHALEYLLQELRPYPMEGVEFVEAALQAAPIRTRNIALYLLESWVTKTETPLDQLLPAFCDLLTRLRDAEPTDDNRERIDRLLSGATFFEEVVPFKKEIEYGKETLNILSDAISDVGSWQWWRTEDDMIQLEFCDVQLYDSTKKEKDAHSSVIAVRFIGHYFAVFLDNLEDENWHVKLHLDQIEPFPIDTYELAFDDVKAAKNVMRSYRRRYGVRPRFDESLFSEAKHILCCKCRGVGFVAGGDRIEVEGYPGIYTEEMITEGNKRWWEYWKDYWRLRNTKDAYEKDFACEVTIPVNPDDPQGEWDTE